MVHPDRWVLTMVGPDRVKGWPGIPDRLMDQPGSPMASEECFPAEEKNIAPLSEWCNIVILCNFQASNDLESVLFVSVLEGVLIQIASVAMEGTC